MGLREWACCEKEKGRAARHPIVGVEGRLTGRVAASKNLNEVELFKSRAAKIFSSSDPRESTFISQKYYLFFNNTRTSS